MSASDLPDLRRAHEGATLLLTLDRPDARNAYSEAMVDSLVRALDEADRDLEQALELAATYQGVVQNTADHHEAVQAMLERRPAKFTGA